MNLSFRRLKIMVFCQSESESNDDVQLLDLDGGMKPQDLESFIDKDDGGEYYCRELCGSVKCKEEPKFSSTRTFSDDHQTMLYHWRRYVHCVATPDGAC
jgi:hypothetical protein